MIDSIKIRTLAAVLTVALGGVALTGERAFHAWQEREAAIALVTASDLRTTLSAGTIELSLERSVSQVALALDGPITPDLASLRDRQRQLSNARFDDVAAKAATISTGSVDAFRHGFAEARDVVRQVRAEIDDLAGRPRAERPAERAAALPNDLKASVLALQAHRLLLQDASFSVPSEISMLETLQEKAWQLREFGGRERTYMVIAVARGEPISPAVRAEMTILHKRVEEIRQEMARLATVARFSGPVMDAIRAVEAGYFGTYARLRQAVLAEADQARPVYPTDFGGFFAASGEALAAVEKIAPAAAAEIHERLAAVTEDATRSIVIDAVILAVFVAGAACATLLVRSAFVRFDDLRRSMEGLAEGDLETSIPHQDTRNEVGRMSATVAVFKSSMLENRRLAAERAAESAAKLHRAEHLDGLTRAFDRAASDMCRHLTNSAAQMEESAKVLGVVAEEAKTQSVAVASAAEQTTANVQRSPPAPRSSPRPSRKSPTRSTDLPPKR